MTHPLKQRRFDRDVDGILLLDKPIGLSSNAALQQARGIYRALKAGHAGSLDPLASGMLPVCFGQATKVCAFLLDARKTYRFTAKLGERSDTGDAEGAIVETQSVPALTDQQVTAALTSFLGESKQIPPMYSALKHKGERLYALARRGEEVERAPRSIVIEALELHARSPAELDISVRCSKGTYVRTLAEDIARALGTVAHLTSLRRLWVEPFQNLPMYTLDDLRSASELDGLRRVLVAPDKALLHLPACKFGPSDEAAILSGQSAAGFSEWNAQEQVAYVRMYGAQDRFLGLGEMVANGLIQPRRLLVKSTINP